VRWPGAASEAIMADVVSRVPDARAPGACFERLIVGAPR